LTSAPPQHDTKAPPVPAVPYRNCRHNLLTKQEQSVGLAPDGELGPESAYHIASYCPKCRWHVDVIVQHQSGTANLKPCGKGNQEYALHHFLYHGEDDSNGSDGLEAQLRPRTYTFRCSAPECSVEVRISMKPPRFSDQDIDTLTNQAQLRRRLEAAKHIAGDRADTVMARRVDGPDYLNTYLQDSLKPTKGKTRIPLLNKKFLKTFGRDCDSILKRLGFEKRQEQEEDGTLVEVWYLPRPDEPAPMRSTLREIIEDARYELNTIILDIPQSERVNCRHQPLDSYPSRPYLEKALACANCMFMFGRLVTPVETDNCRCQGSRTGDTQHKPRRGSSVRTTPLLSPSPFH